MSNAGPDVAANLAHEFIRGLADLRHEVKELNDEVKGLREDLRSSSLQALSDRMDVVIDQQYDLIEVLTFLAQNLNLAGKLGTMLRGALRRSGAPGRPMAP